MTSENKNHNKTEVTVNVDGGRKRGVPFPLFILSILLVGIGCYVGGMRNGENNFKMPSLVGSPALNLPAAPDVFDVAPETPLPSQAQIDTQYIERERIVYLDPPPLNARQQDSVNRIHFATQSFEVPFATQHVVGKLDLDIREGQIVSGLVTTKENKPKPRRHLYAGGAAQVDFSPFAVSSAGVRLLYVPAKGRAAPSVSYDFLNNRLEASLLIRITPQPKPTTTTL